MLGFINGLVGEGLLAYESLDWGRAGILEKLSDKLPIELPALCLPFSNIDINPARAEVPAVKADILLVFEDWSCKSKHSELCGGLKKTPGLKNY